MEVASLDVVVTPWVSERIHELESNADEVTKTPCAQA